MRKVLILSFLLFFTTQLGYDNIPKQILEKERIMRFTIYPRNYHVKKIEQTIETFKEQNSIE